MTFTLKPDDNGIVVVLTNVDENDINKLEAANKKGFDPTEEPFNKYYDYNRSIGFYVDKDHFDHAEHKGKRLSFDDYIAIVSDGEVIPAENAIDAVEKLHLVADSAFAPTFIVSRIKMMREPKNVNDAIAIMSTLNYALHELAKCIDGVDEDLKEDMHKALEHAFKIYDKADNILFDSDFKALIDLSKTLESYRDESANVQTKLLDKFHENF